MPSPSPAPMRPAPTAGVTADACVQRPLLGLRGTSPAVVLDDLTLSHDELRGRVDRWAAAHLGGTRRLVLLENENTLDSLVAHLAVVEHGHVGIVVPPLDESRRAALVADYDPDVTVVGGRAHARREGSVHDLHPDLALLLSTSGSTGSPRMARLSRENVRSNALAIADYLDLGPTDRGLTSLPLHYCYGLSVLHSHLVAGGAVVLTSHSVVDPCFWNTASRAGATTLAAVPHTVDLLEHSGFAERDLPSLRLITQAGGRLAPEKVRALAEAGECRSFDLVVMYGQTEATARMAWLPPHLARSHPDAVGLPIPGGSLRIDSPGRDGVGEVVYSGPNVMMGYADTCADLGRGAELTELRTGDLGRIDDDGLLRITGRASRTAKVFGLRLDLDRVERHLAEDGSVRCVVHESTLHAFGPVADPEELATAAAAFCGLPESAVRGHRLDELPLTPSSKPDYAALIERAATSSVPAPATDGLAVSSAVVADAALVLGRPDATPADTFVSLGGDSLSYVEMATRLEARLGDLPADWHLRPLGELAPLPRRRRLPRVDVSILLRAVAILLIVASHVDVIAMEGGAHLLLALAGWNFARFQLASPSRRGQVAHGLGTLAALVAPSILWIGGVGLATGRYDLSTAFFVHDLTGGREWDDQWQFWFLQALVWASLAAIALVAVPALHRLERARPFGFALGLLAIAASARFAWIGIQAGPTERYTTPVVAFFFVLGWAGARARTILERLVVSAAAIGLTVGFFGQPQREAIIIGGFLVAMWLPRLPMPSVVVRAAGVVAGASLAIYLTQWQVYPPLEDAGHPWLALVAALAVGVLYGRLMRPVQRRVQRWVSQRCECLMRPDEARESLTPRLRGTPRCHSRSS